MKNTKNKDNEKMLTKIKEILITQYTNNPPPDPCGTIEKIAYVLYDNGIEIKGFIEKR